MLKKIKLAFITLGLASGMTTGALVYLHNVDKCRAMVLMDLSKHAQFTAQLEDFTQTRDFLAALTKGKR